MKIEDLPHLCRLERHDTVERNHNWIQGVSDLSLVVLLINEKIPLFTQDKHRNNSLTREKLPSRKIKNYITRLSYKGRRTISSTNTKNSKVLTTYRVDDNFSLQNFYYRILNCFNLPTREPLRNITLLVTWRSVSKPVRRLNPFY